MRRFHVVSFALAATALVALGVALAVSDAQRRREVERCRALTYPPLRWHRSAQRAFPWIGTHNSYRREPLLPLSEEWLEHAPLREQVKRGARHFELDVHYGVLIYHLPWLDEETHCRCYTECLYEIANATYDSLVIFLELKDVLDLRWRDVSHEALLSLERDTREVLGERLATPPLALEHLDGRVAIVLTTPVEYEGAFYRVPHEFEMISDPYNTSVAEVARHRYVRTRADHGRRDDERWRRAHASGAQFVATDFLREREDE